MERLEHAWRQKAGTALIAGGREVTARPLGRARTGSAPSGRRTIPQMITPAEALLALA